MAGLGTKLSQDEDIAAHLDEAAGVDPAIDLGCQDFQAELIEDVPRLKHLLIIGRKSRQHRVDVATWKPVRLVSYQATVC